MILDLWLIQGYDLHEASSGDKRPVLLDISHFQMGQNEKDGHKISVCVDLKNHRANMLFHINVDWKSQQLSCSSCKKIVADHPMGLNHMPISGRRGVGDGPPYKIIDHEIIVENILKHLVSLGIFKGYPEKNVTPIFPTSSQWLQKISKII